MDGVPVNWKGFSLKLHIASVYYLGGVDPKLEWQVRGISAHDINQELKQSLEAQKHQALVNFAKDSKTRAAAQRFTDESSHVMEGLLTQGRGFIKKYLGSRKFKFVLGAMRTGGTFLYKELCEVHGQQWDSLSLDMSHDSIPEYGHLAYWKRSNAILPLLFDMAQFFVWVKRELESDIVLQKRIAYVFALPFLQELFSDSAEYFLTVRHPLPLAYSFAKVMGEDPHSSNVQEPAAWYSLVKENDKDLSRERWNTLSYFDKALAFWREYHLPAASSREAVGNIHVVTYGESFNQFLDLYREKHGNPANSGYLKFSARALQGEMDPSALDETFATVKQAWSAVGLKFETPEVV